MGSCVTTLTDAVNDAMGQPAQSQPAAAAAPSPSPAPSVNMSVNGSSNALVGGWLRNCATGLTQWVVLTPTTVDVFGGPTPLSAPLLSLARSQFTLMVQDGKTMEPFFYLYAPHIRDQIWQSIKAESRPTPVPAGAGEPFKAEVRGDHEMTRFVRAWDRSGGKSCSGTIDPKGLETAKGRADLQKKFVGYSGGQPAPTFTAAEEAELNPAPAASSAPAPSAGSGVNGSSGALVGGWLKHVPSGAFQWVVLNANSFDLYAAPSGGAVLRSIPRASVSLMVQDGKTMEPFFYLYSAGVRDQVWQSVKAESRPSPVPAGAPAEFKAEPRGDHEMTRFVRAWDRSGGKSSSGTIDPKGLETAKGRADLQKKFVGYSGGQPAPTFTAAEEAELNPAPAAAPAVPAGAALNGASNNPIAGGWLKHVPTEQFQWAVLTKDALELYAAPTPLSAPLRTVPRAGVSIMVQDGKTLEPFFYLYSAGVRDQVWQSVKAESRPSTVPANAAEAFQAKPRGDHEMTRFVRGWDASGGKSVPGTIEPQGLNTPKGRAALQERFAGYAGGQPEPTFTAAEQAELASAAASVVPAGAANSYAAAAEAEEEEENDSPRTNGFEPGLSIFASLFLNVNHKGYWCVFSNESVDMFERQFRADKKVQEQPVASLPIGSIKKYVANSNKSREPALVLFDSAGAQHLFTVPAEHHGAAAAPRFKKLEQVLSGFSVFAPIPGCSFVWEVSQDFEQNKKNWQAQVDQYTGGN